MTKSFHAICTAFAFTASMGAASMAEARTYHTNAYGRYYVARGERVYVERYDQRAYKDCRRAANKGAALGAIGGGVVGNVAGHNTTSTLLGVGVGAVAGHQIAKSNCKRG